MLQFICPDYAQGIAYLVSDFEKSALFLGGVNTGSKPRHTSSEVVNTGSKPGHTGSESRHTGLGPVNTVIQSSQRGFRKMLGKNLNDISALISNDRALISDVSTYISDISISISDYRALISEFSTSISIDRVLILDDQNKRGIINLNL